MKKDQGIYANSFPKPPESFWISSTPKTNYPSLEENITVDVAVIGGGMAGITSAYLLKREGLRVAVLEADRILLGTTAHTTAKLTSQHGLFYHKLKQQMGEERARQYAQANEQAIKFVADHIKEQKIDCDFSWQSAYIYTQSDEYVQQIMDEQKTASALGINAVYETEIPLPFSVKAAVRFDHQAQFHPRKYLLVLAKDIDGDGSYIFEHSRVVDIQRENPEAYQRGPYSVITHNSQKFMASYVIMASHYPCHNYEGLYFTRLYPERAYAIAVKAKESFSGGMYINAENPTRSLRSLPTDQGERILIVGEKHKTGHGENLTQHYENLTKFANEHYTVEDIPYRWSTQDLTSTDEIPYIGQMTSNTPNLYIATGFRKWGMTHSIVSAMMIRDSIIKEKNPWAELYNPSRFTPGASAKNFIVENADVAANFVTGKILPPSGDSKLKPGEAEVVMVDGQKTGVYMDEHHRLHKVDTTCTHLGCELHWNNAETSWDCPCHGSRFTVDGEIIEGPTMRPLDRVESSSQVAES